jgi:hypothetical protein
MPRRRAITVRFRDLVRFAKTTPKLAAWVIPREEEIRQLALKGSADQ